MTSKIYIIYIEESIPSIFFSNELLATIHTNSTSGSSKVIISLPSLYG